MVARIGAVGFGREQRHARPQPLPACGEHSPDRFGDERIVGREGRAEKLLDERREIVVVRAFARGLDPDHALPT